MTDLIRINFSRPVETRVDPAVPANRGNALAAFPAESDTPRLPYLRIFGALATAISGDAVARKVPDTFITSPPLPAWRNVAT